MFGAYGTAPAATSVNFVAPIALESGALDGLGLAKRAVAVGDCRGLSKDDLPNNTARPDVRVDADTFAVRIDGDLVTEAPAAELPMAQRYFLF